MCSSFLYHSNGTSPIVFRGATCNKRTRNCGIVNELKPEIIKRAMFYIKQQMGLTSSSEESLSSTAGASGSSESASEPSPLSSKDSDPCSSNNRRWTINAYSQTKQTNKKKARHKQLGEKGRNPSKRRAAPRHRRRTSSPRSTGNRRRRGRYRGRRRCAPYSVKGLGGGGGRRVVSGGGRGRCQPEGVETAAAVGVEEAPPARRSRGERESARRRLGVRSSWVGTL